MPDLAVLTGLILRFRDDRNWSQFHTPKNLAASVCIEAAELLECLQWVEGEAADRAAVENKQRLAGEIADVAIYLLLLADRLGVDLEQAVLDKLEENARKYPVDLARGNAKKYTELEGSG